MLSIEELSELESEILEILPEKITEILSRANRNGQLEELLKIMGLSDLIGCENTFETYREQETI